MSVIISRNAVASALNQVLDASQRADVRSFGGNAALVDSLTRICNKALNEWRVQRWTPAAVSEAVTSRCEELTVAYNARMAELELRMTDLAKADPRYWNARQVEDRLREYAAGSTNPYVQTQAIRSIGMVWAAAFGMTCVGGAGGHDGTGETTP